MTTKLPFTIEIDNSIIERLSKLPTIGVCMTIKGGLNIFISQDKIGIFSQDTIESFNRDFSKIKTTEIKPHTGQSLDMEDFPDVSNSIQ